MALPLIKKTVSVVPLPSWQKILFIASGAVLLVLCVVFFWLWRMVGRANATLENRMEDLAALDERARVAGDRLRRLKNDVRALGALLERHVSPVAFIEFFEDITHPGTYWKSLEASLKDPRRVRLLGVGKTFESVAEQIERVRQSPLVESSTIGVAKRAAGGRVEFSMEMTPKATIWRFK